MWMFLNISVLQGGVVSTSPNPQAVGPPLVGCPRLLIQFIRSYPPTSAILTHTHTSLICYRHWIIIVVGSGLKSTSIFLYHHSCDVQRDICCRIWSLLVTLSQGPRLWAATRCVHWQFRRKLPSVLQKVPHLFTCVKLSLTTVRHSKYYHYLWHFLLSWFSSDAVFLNWALFQLLSWVRPNFHSCWRKDIQILTGRVKKTKTRRWAVSSVKRHAYYTYHF